jgi:hypothetical protein
LKSTKLFLETLNAISPIAIKWAKPGESQTNTLGLNELQLVDVPSGEIPKLIEEHSFGVSICRQDAGISLSAVMPTKIAEFLAVGRPVVINKGLGDFESLIMEFQAGIVIDLLKDDYQEKAEQLRKILSDQQTPRRCRDLAEKYFDNTVAAQTYFGLYQKLLPDLKSILGPNI